MISYQAISHKSQINIPNFMKKINFLWTLEIFQISSQKSFQPKKSIQIIFLNFRKKIVKNHKNNKLFGYFFEWFSLNLQCLHWHFRRNCSAKTLIFVIFSRKYYKQPNIQKFTFLCKRLFEIKIDEKIHQWVFRFTDYCELFWNYNNKKWNYCSIILNSNPVENEWTILFFYFSINCFWELCFI